ncbi:Crp/Fnr family transcriptional regulator [Sphingobium algorifonticola]|uniref:Crp/Fnr family transcriptional regulator n=1 Tax=Sphingobium algorifonticola TaxID=2008318 RepID=A0A437J732_9SPHN|nr:Crp/Fnr family transcriptional regulator [Sphingobium algorifonticola]RVT40847.1 Crp/Fnr family transcriptional regulator [Sphingobium algorifonticola]
MDIVTLYAKLPEHSLLRSLGPDDLGSLLADAHEHKAKKAAVLLQQGDPGDFLLILLEGQARVTVYSANGREIVLEYAGAGSVLGEIALIDGGLRTASVIAMGPVRYLTLARPVFERVIAANHRIALRLMREMAMRLRLANDTIETDRAYGAAPRLARFLLRLLRTSEGGVISLSQTELALFAGISRENINRQLAIWAQGGIVALEQGRIHVTDPEMLEDIADAME